MIIPAGYGQLNFFFVGAPLPFGAQVTMGFKNEAAHSAETCASDARQSWDIADFDASMATGITFTGVLCKLGPNDVGPSAFSAASTAATGGTAGAAAPAILVRKNTALGGRHGKGRMYIPGLPESQIDPGGLVAATTVTAYQTRVNALLTALNSASMTPALLHGDATAPSLITSMSVQSVVATQRRRQRR